MRFAVITVAIAALCFFDGTNAFAPVRPLMRSPVSTVDRSSSNSALHLNLPRLELPAALTEKLTEFDLKNPNEMNAEEYKSYSGAAIGGTLLFFLLPGAFLLGIPDEIVSILGAIVKDFIFSAVTGGGLAIYLSLRSDSIGETARDLGSKLLTALKDATGIPTLRYDIPEAVTEVMTDKLGLMNPNSMSEEEYGGYSGAAVAGTLAFFLLPGAILTGTTDVLGEFAASAISDFLVSAPIGGGLAIYLSLRDDEIGATVNTYGAKLLDTVDGLLDINSVEESNTSSD